MLRPGDLVGGKYRILRLIGEGGMGAVYEARHERLGSTVALKCLLPELAERPALVARFLQEARVSAAIRSPHVTQVMDVDQTPDGAPYLVMELLHGESLESRLAREGRLAETDAVDVAIQVLLALEAAHAHGVVHRDLKPDNVWLEPTDGGPNVKLLDFGIAKLRVSGEFPDVHTRPGSMMGTPAYMAPEQAISADQVDQRADLYSLGVILYEMLSGLHPVDGEEPQEILERLVRGEVHPLATRCPSLPPALCSLVDRLVAPNPDERPSSAAEVRAALSPFGRVSLPAVSRAPMAPASAAARGSVPPTVPPVDEAPPFVTQQQPVAPRITTDAMPRVADLGSAPTALPTTAGHGSFAPPRRARRRWPVVVLLLVLAGAGGAGIWLAMNPWVLGDDVVPPLPGPLPSEAPAPAVLDTDSPADLRASPRRVPPRPARPSTANEPEAAGSEPVTLPMPTFQIPTVLPLPPGVLPVPSTLPQYFPQIPGVTAPTAAPAAPTAPTAPTSPPQPP